MPLREHKRLIVAITVTVLAGLIALFAGDKIGPAVDNLLDPSKQPYFKALFESLGIALWVAAVAETIGKHAWADDAARLNTTINKLESAIRDLTSRLDTHGTDFQEFRRTLAGSGTDITALRNESSALLSGLPKAIGGSFTQSLFEYHPAASKEIARILSNDIAELYERHCRRVVVHGGRDVYRLLRMKELRRGHHVAYFWELEFHIVWEWLNDSAIVKTPLRDLLILATAPTEALEAVTFPTATDKLNKLNAREVFIREHENVVRSLIPNPFADEALLDEGEIIELFSIESVTVGTETVPFAAFAPVPAASLPVGVYGAFTVPLSERHLQPGEKIMVEYKGKIGLRVTDEGGTLVGLLQFPPSDVVSKEYELIFEYPKSLTAPDNMELDLRVLRDRSGCQRLHEPLRNNPTLTEQTGTGGTRMVATIDLDHPLTDLHTVTMIWTGTRKTVAHPEPTHNPRDKGRARAGR